MPSPFDELLLPGSLREGPPAAAPDAANWLSGVSARDVLNKLTRDDPLGIEARCAVRLHERAILVGRERVVMRAMAQVAFRAKDYRAWQPLDAFLRVHIDRAIDALIERDREEERARMPHEDDEAWGFLTRALGVGPDQARRAAVESNVEATETSGMSSALPSVLSCARSAKNERVRARTAASLRRRCYAVVPGRLVRRVARRVAEWPHANRGSRPDAVAPLADALSEHLTEDPPRTAAL